MFWIDLLTVVLSIYDAYCGFNVLFSSIQTAFKLHHQRQKIALPLTVGIMVAILIYCFSIPADWTLINYSSMNNIQASLLVATSLSGSLIFHFIGIDRL